MSRPVEHVQDSHQLVADAEIDLYELTPSGGSGTIYLKNDNNATWRGIVYEGVPIGLSGEGKSSDTGLTMPKMTIGNGALDLSPFKGLVHEGYLDNAIIVRKTVLLDNLINNRLIFEGTTFRVKRVENYGRTQIVMQLATLSDSLGFSLPFRQFLPPGFPSVQMD